MLQWLRQFNADTASRGNEEVLLGMDNHGAQQTDAFREHMRLSNIVPAYTPPDCTMLFLARTLTASISLCMYVAYV